jgi:hypothetical protein
LQERFNRRPSYLAGRPGYEDRVVPQAEISTGPVSSSATPSKTLPPRSTLAFMANPSEVFGGLSATEYAFHLRFMTFRHLRYFLYKLKQ